MLKNLILASTLLLFSAGSYAGMDHGPCTADKEKFCNHCEKGQKDCFKSCMKKNKDKISAECKAHKAQMKQMKKSKDKRSDWDKRH